MKIIECPRDAMQGLHDFIPTETKISYLNSLLAVGFDTLDCGSFVSPKIIPQMKDTADVLAGIDTSETSTKLSVVVVNISGSKKALEMEKINVLGFPFSISETFQQRNTHKTREEALKNIEEIMKMVENSDKELLLYFSMAFGNPYNDQWNLDEILRYTEQFANMGITTINLSDTVGVADEKSIEILFSAVQKEFPELEFGAHMHTQYEDWKPRIQTAYDLGCRRFDGAIKGFGGCPMAKDDLVGNMPTEKLLNFMEENKISHDLNIHAFESAYNKALEVFS